jgi:hypothetical protein
MERTGDVCRNPTKDASKREQSETGFDFAEREHAQPKVKSTFKSKKK